MPWRVPRCHGDSPKFIREIVFRRCVLRRHAMYTKSHVLARDAHNAIGPKHRKILRSNLFRGIPRQRGQSFLG
jgi:hypothetical protein